MFSFLPILGSCGSLAHTTRRVWRNARPLRALGFSDSRCATDTSFVLGIERRTLHTATSAEATRRAVRSRLRPILADIPGGWLGRRLEPGVIGFGLRNHFVLGAIPPDRTLLTNRKSPLVLCRIVPMQGGGCDLRLSLYPYGFPWYASTDAAAVAFLDDWLSGVASYLSATADSVD
jgi:hypothetical protein